MGTGGKKMVKTDFFSNSSNSSSSSSSSKRFSETYFKLKGHVKKHAWNTCPGRHPQSKLAWTTKNEKKKQRLNFEQLPAPSLPQQNKPYVRCSPYLLAISSSTLSPPIHLIYRKIVGLGLQFIYDQYETTYSFVTPLLVLGSVWWNFNLLTFH